MQQAGPPPTPAAARAAAKVLEAAKMEAVLEDAKERGGLRHLKVQPDWLPRLKMPAAPPAAAAAAATTATVPAPA